MERRFMAHSYSVTIHDYISEKISVAKSMQEQAKVQNALENYNFYRGQLEELFKIREYLTDRIDLQTQKYF